MSIRTDDLGFVFYEADEQEEKELEYVYAITDSWNYMGDEVIDTFPRRFWDRVCQEKIKAPFTKEMFLQETDIIAASVHSLKLPMVYKSQLSPTLACLRLVD